MHVPLSGLVEYHAAATPAFKTDGWALSVLQVALTHRLVLILGDAHLVTMNCRRANVRLKDVIMSMDVSTRKLRCTIDRVTAVDDSDDEAGLSNGEAGLSNGEAGLSNDEAGLSNDEAGLSNGEAGLSNGEAESEGEEAPKEEEWGRPRLRGPNSYAQIGPEPNPEP